MRLGPRRARSITVRLTLLFAVASTVVLLILGLIVAESVENHFEELDMTELAGKLELIRHVMARVRSPAELQGIPRQMEDAFFGHHGLVVAVQSAQGETLFASGHGPFPQALFDRRHTPGADRHPYVWQADGVAFRGIVA